MSTLDQNDPDYRKYLAATTAGNRAELNDETKKELTAQGIREYIKTGDPVQEVKGVQVFADWAVEGVYRANFKTDDKWIEAAWEKNGDKGIIQPSVEAGLGNEAQRSPREPRTR